MQQLTYNADGSAMKVTTARYLTPRNRIIDGIGLAPDVNVAENAHARYGDPAADAQLAAAIGVVQAKARLYGVPTPIQAVELHLPSARRRARRSRRPSSFCMPCALPYAAMVCAGAGPVLDVGAPSRLPRGADDGRPARAAVAYSSYGTSRSSRGAQRLHARGPVLHRARGLEVAVHGLLSTARCPLRHSDSSGEQHRALRDRHESTRAPCSLTAFVRAFGPASKRAASILDSSSRTRGVRLRIEASHPELRGQPDLQHVDLVSGGRNA